MNARRVALVVAAATLAAGAAFVAAGSPRLTLLNSGLRIDYPWWRGVALFPVAAGAGLLGALAKPRWLRVLAACAGLGLGLFGLDRLLYRLDAGPDGLSSHGLFAATNIPWREVGHVQAGTDMLVVTDRAEGQIWVRTGSFAPDQRASLERTITRRVDEAQARPQNQ
jgi:hypothetical protein